jgi:hypothetical protein
MTISFRAGQSPSRLAFRATDNAVVQRRYAAGYAVMLAVFGQDR